MSIKQRPAYEKRSAGHPKKDEIIIRPLMFHNFERMKPENAVMAAKDTIKTANNLYKRYSREYPNPLNIDDKDLTPEAKACWEFIFSERGYIGDEAVRGRRGGSRIFDSTDEIVFAFECYVNWIRSKNFVKGFVRPDGEPGVMPIIPNQSNFAQWLGLSRKQITNVMYQDPEAQQQYKRILADCLSEGAMVGAYNTASTIFTLKNMCDWADKYEDRSRDKADDLGVEEAAELMKQLGYAREKAKLEPPKPMIEGDADG